MRAHGVYVAGQRRSIRTKRRANARGVALPRLPGQLTRRLHLYSTAYKYNVPVARCACDCDKQWYHIPNTSARRGSTRRRRRSALHGSTHARSLIPLLSLFLPPPSSSRRRHRRLLSDPSRSFSFSLVTRPSRATRRARRRIRTRLFEGAGVVRETRRRYAPVFEEKYSFPCFPRFLVIQLGSGGRGGEGESVALYMRVVYTHGGDCLDEVVSIIVYFIVGHVNTV